MDKQKLEVDDMSETEERQVADRRLDADGRDNGDA